ncbi:hypothetical protein LDFHOB_09565 [Candidatus Electronema aureum]
MLAAALSMTGCAEFVYDSMHYERVSECESLDGQEREDCLVQAQKTYEQYESEREEEIKKDKSASLQSTR